MTPPILPTENDIPGASLEGRKLAELKMIFSFGCDAEMSMQRVKRESRTR